MFNILLSSGIGRNNRETECVLYLHTYHLIPIEEPPDHLNIVRHHQLYHQQQFKIFFSQYHTVFDISQT